MPLVRIFQVDAFSDRVFGGNPAAVCPLDDWLDDTTLQSIAQENNLSETAFFVADEPTPLLRWFTPTTEVDLCGHATLAAAFVVMTQLRPNATSVEFKTLQVGLLSVERQDDGSGKRPKMRLAMRLPARPPARVESAEAVCSCLDIRPQAVFAANKYMAVLASEAEVADVVPRLDRIAALDRDGLIVTAPGETVDFVSRYFAPHAGIDEDPVTGSAHATLVPYWSGVLGKKTLQARQISKRQGELECIFEGDFVVLLGRAALYMRGQIEVP